MLSFNSADFSCQSNNKGIDFGAQIVDEPFEDFFNQFTHHESADLGNNANDSNPFGSIDFPTDEDTASSESYNNAFPEISFTNTEHTRHHSRADRQLSQASQSSQPQSYRKAARTERPKPVISGLELLSLEGKLPPSSKVHIPPLSAPAATPALPLRRKPRFCATPPETLRDQNHRISKSPCNVGGDPSKMMRPSCHYRHEMPSRFEWTQRFEHISLQPQGANPSTGSQLPEDDFQDEASTQTQTLSSNFSSENLSQNDTSFMQNGTYDDSGLGQHYATTQIAGLAPLPSHVSFQRPDARPRHHSRTASFQASHQGHHKDLRREKAKSHSALPQIRPMSSWTQVETIPEHFDYTVSPGQVQPNWFQNLPDSSRPYDECSIAAQSAPTLAPTNQGFSQGLRIQDEQYGHFINEDPSGHYLVSPTATDFDVHSPVLSPGINRFARPQTPSSPSSSRSPSPVTPSRARRQSKQHSRRKSSVGTLKSAKSASSVFVNYTPRDREKIVNSVAPSGSSKTKARREQEANEKRRKMSLAAEKVVQEAGGDIEKLRAAGIFELRDP